MSTIKLKRSGETGSAPGTDDLVHGELAINYADNKLYTLGHGGAVIDLLEVSERVGVSAWNGQSGTVVFNDYVSSFNGLTGAIQGVSAWNGSTGAVVFNDYVSSFNGLTGAIQGVSAWNGLTGDVTTRGVTACVGGVTLGGGGATFAGSVNFKGGISADVGATFGGNIVVPEDGWIGRASDNERFVFNGDGNVIYARTPNLDIEWKLRHYGDSDTTLNFTTDDVTIQAGGNEFLHGTSTYAEINTGFSAAGATFSGPVHFEAGISADSGATFAGAINTTAGTTDLNALKTGALLINDNYNFPTGAGATGDVLMIADDGDLEFEPLRMSANFVVDSDIPLATGVRYKALYAVPMQKMAVTNIDLRSHDVSPAGSGDSLQVALKTIRRFSDLEAASPSIQTTVETVAIALGGEYHSQVTGVSVDNPDVGSVNSASYLVVDVVSNAGNHTNFCMTVTMEARP